MVRQTPAWKKLSEGDDQAVAASRNLQEKDLAKLVADGSKEVVERYRAAKKANHALSKTSASVKVRSARAEYVSAKREVFKALAGALAKQVGRSIQAVREDNAMHLPWIRTADNKRRSFKSAVSSTPRWV